MGQQWNTLIIMCYCKRAGEGSRRICSVVTFSFMWAVIFFLSLCKVAAPIFAFNFGTKLRWRKNEHCAALDIQWPTAGLACTCSWETWLKDSKECESVSVRGFVYVNTHSCSQGSYSLQTDAIDTQTSALTCFVSKLCKVTFNLGAHFIFSRTLRN